MIFNVMIFMVAFASLQVYAVIITWPQQIETGRLTMINLLPGQTEKTYTFNFLTSRNNGNFAWALGIEDMEQRTITSQYSVKIIQTGPISQTKIMFRISSYSIGNLINVVYHILVVEDTYPYVSILHFVKDYTSTAATYTSSGNVNQFAVPHSLNLNSSSDYVARMLKGYYIESGNITKASIYSSCFIDASNVLWCQFFNNQGGSYSYFYLAVDIVIVHLEAMRNDFNGNTIGLNFGQYNSTQTQDLGRTTFNRDLMFLGTTGFSIQGITNGIYFKITTAVFPMDIVHLTSPMQTEAFFLYFEILMQCPGEAEWNISLNQCVNCTNSTFLNSSDVCAPCSQLSQDCLECNATDCHICNNSLIPLNTSCLFCHQIFNNCASCNSSQCSSCVNNSFILLGSDCQLCQTNWSNCVTCSQTECLSCVSPYIVNNATSQCSLCQEVWPNCSDCNNYSCLNCSNPYILNGTSSCFLCQDAFSNCSSCTVLGCTNCSSPFVLDLASQCFLCGDTWSNCSSCNATACLLCSSPYVLNGTDTCFLCENVWANCTSCDAQACLGCSVPYILNSTGSTNCFLCGEMWPNCDTCNSSQCTLCFTNYTLNVSTGCFKCQDQWANCSTCSGIACQGCDSPYVLNSSGSTQCFLCGEAWPNCDTCNQSQCTLCNTNFTLNGTEGCFICGDVWPNCTTCNGLSCQDCSSPFILNTTSSTCFLCDQVWPNCTNCTQSGCSQCSPPYQVNGTYCFVCQNVWQHCSSCNTMSCLSCTPPYVSDLSSCFLCHERWSNCNGCDMNGCLNCSVGFIWNSTDCFSCQSIQGCASCSSMNTCDVCLSPYVQNGSLCQPNCSIVDFCSSCSAVFGQIICSNCSSGWHLSGNKCEGICGDGAMVGLEECDDQNSIDGDGCSSSCRIQDYFACTNSISGPSQCILTKLDATPIALAKVSGKNEIVLSFDLYPQNLQLYESANWTKAFSAFSPNLTVLSASISNGKRLRVQLAYHSNLYQETIQMVTNFSEISASVNVSLVSSTLPESINNNLALFYFEDSAYSLASAIQYLSLAVSAFSLLLFGAGYFGSKLQSLEAVAVVQVSALLLVTQEDMGPAFEGLRSLRLSMGLTPLSEDEYYYEDSSIPSHIAPVLSSRDSVWLFNIFLLVLFVPLVTALVLRVLSATVCEGHWAVERAWKYSLGSFLFYGLLFLAYGQLASLALGLRHFEASVSSGMGVLAGALFLALLVLWGIATFRYPTWFGSFKSKFFKFQVSQHFYVISAAERVLTALLVVSLSPGLVGAGLAALIFTAEGVFILAKKPYTLGTWKRPLLNKVGAALISLLFVGAAVTRADSTINQMIPLVILLILAVVLVVATIGAVSQIHQYWSTREERFEVVRKAGPPMTVEESHKMLMQQFQRKMMPDMSGMSSIWRPVEHEHVDIDKWKWQKYPILNSLDMHQQFRSKMKKMRQKKQKQKQNEIDNPNSHDQMRNVFDQL